MLCQPKISSFHHFIIQKSLGIACGPSNDANMRHFTHIVRPIDSKIGLNHLVTETFNSFSKTLHSYNTSNVHKFLIISVNKTFSPNRTDPHRKIKSMPPSLCTISLASCTVNLPAHTPCSMPRSQDGAHVTPTCQGRAAHTQSTRGPSQGIGVQQ